MNFDRHHPRRLSHEDYAEPNQVVFVTLHAARGRALLSMRPCAEVIISCIRHGCILNHVDLVAYCVMPDHVHVVVYTNDGADIEGYLRGLKWAVSRQLHRLGVVGAIWQRSYWDRNHRDDDDVRTMIEYVLDNPVRKGLCRYRNDWPFGEYVGHPGS